MNLDFLRDYQQDAVTWVRERERSGSTKICVQSPTGSGKTKMLVDLLLDPVPQMVLTHRRVLLDQLAKVLDAHGVSYSFRAAGMKCDFDARVMLAMVQTEHARTIKNRKWPKHNAQRVHIDELHVVRAQQALDILAAYKNKLMVGWTATPRELGHIVDELYVAATVPQLIKKGYLVPPVVYGPEVPDMERLERAKTSPSGEWSPKELAKFWSSKKVFSRVLEYYRVLNNGTPAIGFAPGVAESIWFAEKFTQEGVPSAHIDAKTVWLDGEHHKNESDIRAEVFRQLKSGLIKVVWNRFVLREGLDLPEAGHAILATPFGARTSYVQAVGRVLRPAAGKTFAVIQDHGGSWIRHPAIDSEEPWDYHTKAKILEKNRIDALRDDIIPEPIVCPKCFAARAAGDTCLQCGFKAEKQGRMVRQYNGELKLVTGKMYKRAEKKQRTDQSIWESHFWGARKHKPHMTFRQVYAWACRGMGKGGLDGLKKFTPKDPLDWNAPVGSVHFRDLY